MAALTKFCTRGDKKEFELSIWKLDFRNQLLAVSVVYKLVMKRHSRQKDMEHTEIYTKCTTPLKQETTLKTQENSSKLSVQMLLT